ncbi:MAG: ABC transporter permease subunit [Candidatus Aminicenantes bacterium]|nr:ABC transporter permease subunit [Candidatus Aminicenantes bacterium]
MSIREKGYHRWDGRLEERRRGWKPIARLGIRLAFKRKHFKFAFSLSFLPAFVFLAGIYLSERLQDFEGIVRKGAMPLRVVPGYFLSYLTADFVLFMTVVLLIFCAAGLVADDLKHNALQLYFARPLAKRDYVLGKAAVVMFFVLLLTLVPGLLLVVFKIVFSGSFGLLRDHPGLPLAIVVYSAAAAVFFASYSLLLSSLSRNRRTASFLIFGIYVFSDMLAEILRGIFRTPYVGLVSVKTNLKLAAAPLFGTKPVLEVPSVYAFVVLAAVVAAGAWVMNRRIRGVTIIK